MKKFRPIFRLLVILVLAGLLAYAVILAIGLRQPRQLPVVIQHSDTRLVRAAIGAQAAVDITATGIKGDNRIFITGQGGKIYISDGKGGDVSNSVFLDISGRVMMDGEQGLLGLAFDPDYAKNGYFYVNYIARTDRGTHNGETIGPGDTVVSRFTRSSTDAADPASELILIGYDQPQKNHNGGGLVFGPDKMLYIGAGDGGAGGDPHTEHCAYGNGQCLSTYLGKILRIDVRGAAADKPYTVPGDNPFAHTPGAKPEIWHYGLRNPWRFSFDPQNGDMLIGDVGQGDWEEVDRAPAGQKGLNFGWRCFEGSHAFNAAGNPGCADTAGFTQPVYEYDHSAGQCSITGGYVYRGTYIYSDYCSSKIYYLGRPAAGTWKLAATIRTDFPQKSVSSLGLDNAGEPYVALLTGEVYHIEIPR